VIPEPESPSRPAADPGFASIESVLVVHNRYRQWGGEDAVFDSETELLTAHGHRVERLIVDNDAIPDHPSASGRIRLAARTVWSDRAAAAVADRARAVGASVVHIHNFVPLLSPAIHGAARSTGAAVVQTLHNYRLICPAATLFRDGAPCNDCVGRRITMPAVVHACYRDSRAQTAVITAMLAVHRARRTWERDVDAFIALTEFGRERFVEGGLPADRIAVKPNFVADRDGGANEDSAERRYAEGPFLFVGRLSPEKGVETLIAAWPHVGGGRSLRVVGDGPLADRIRSAAESVPGVTVVGPLSRDDVDREMRSAAALVFPSVWYEGMPITLIEAFAAGLPVVASRLGAMETMVQDGHTGILVAPADAGALAEAITRASADPAGLAAMGAAARNAYLETYAPDSNYARLAEIYASAVARRRASASG
jgi:glycosyltransferase involved in cell wall biosynthesis